jgi:hypothetical protein
MERRDLFALGLAVGVVILLAMVGKPMISGSSLPVPFLTSADAPVVEDLPAPSIPPLPSVPQSPPSWDGCVQVLHLIGSGDSNTTDLPMMTPAPGTTLSPRAFVGESTVSGAYPVIPDYKPSIPELAVQRPTLNSSIEEDMVIIYDETYNLQYNSIGLSVNIVKPPFTLEFSTKPLTNNEYYLNNPHYCFQTITVRDAKTMEIVTENGYAGIYGTEPEKVISLYRSGSYHLTLYGNMVQVRFIMKARG